MLHVYIKTKNKTILLLCCMVITKNKNCGGNVRDETKKKKNRLFRIIL